MEKKVAHAEHEKSIAEATMSHKEGANRKLTLQNANLSKSISDLQTSLGSMISKSHHEEATAKLHSQLQEKEAIVSSLNSQIKERSALLSKLETDLRDVRSAYSEMESIVNERSADESRSREELDLLYHRLNDSQAEAERQSTVHNEQIKALERSHSLALSMLEISHTNQSKKLQTELDLMTKLVRFKDSQIDQMNAKIVEMKIRIVDQRARDVCIDIGVKSVTDKCPQTCQTDTLVTRTVHTETDQSTCLIFLREDQVTELRKYISCSSCRDSASRVVSTLFPCGHGLCSDCVADVMQADLNRVGIACRQCANNMPITRISLNYPMIALSEYLSSILTPGDC